MSVKSPNFAGSKTELFKLAPPRLSSSTILRIVFVFSYTVLLKIGSKTTEEDLLDPWRGGGEGSQNLTGTLHIDRLVGLLLGAEWPEGDGLVRGPVAASLQGLEHGIVEVVRAGVAVVAENRTQVALYSKLSARACFLTNEIHENWIFNQILSCHVNFQSQHGYPTTQSVK
jgi:hypothetical protein